MDKVRANIVITVATKYGLPLQLAKLMACQSAFETANWTNNNFIKNNNGFGYKRVQGAKLQLPTSGIKSTESDCYAAYPSFENSILEVCAWINRRQTEGKFPRDLTTIQFPENYAYLLKSCGYYGALEADYAKGISHYLEILNETENA